MFRNLLTLLPLLFLAAACSPDPRVLSSSTSTPDFPPTASATNEPPTDTATPAPSVTASATHYIVPTATQTDPPTSVFFRPTDCPTLTPTPTVTSSPEVSLTPTATSSPTATRTPTATLDPAVTVTPTPIPTSGPSPTPTTTPTLTPSVTWTPHPCPSPTPTVTLTPTPSLTPTPTPVLPAFADLLISSADLDSVDPDFWQDPPDNFTTSLRNNSSNCEVDCAGLRWESNDGQSTLTLLLYRTPDFPDAIAVASGAQTYYLEAGFITVPIPPVGNLPAFTWAGVLADKDLVIITSQGPAVLIFFWQNTSAGNTGPQVESITHYAGFQAAILRNNGFLTVSLHLTPFP